MGPGRGATQCADETVAAAVPANGAAGGSSDGGGSGQGDAALAKRPPGRPPKASGEYSKHYLRLKEYRQRQKDSVAGLNAEVKSKLEELNLLSAENQALQVGRAARRGRRLSGRRGAVPGGSADGAQLCWAVLARLPADACRPTPSPPCRRARRCCET
jgi:hypothetical protein